MEEDSSPAELGPTESKTSEAQSDIVFHFDDLVLEPATRRLRLDDDIELPPRLFDLLERLVRTPHVLHTRQELLETVWHDTVVTDASLTQAISALRRALGEPGKSLIVTVPKVGYRFEANVEPRQRLKAVSASSEPKLAAIPPSESSTPAEPTQAVAPSEPAVQQDSVPTPSTQRRSPWLWPTLALALLALASTHWFTGQQPRSPEVSQAALAAYSEGVLLSERYQLTEARKELELALTEAPDFPLAHLAQAEVLHRLGHHRDALYHAGKALEGQGDPDSRSALEAQARYQELAGDWQAACETHRRLDTTYPSHEHRLALARCLVEIDQPRQALKLLEDDSDGSGSALLWVETLLARSRAQQSLSDYPLAASLASQAAERAAEVGLEHQQMEALQEQAESLFYSGARGQAVDLLFDAKKRFRDAGNDIGAMELEHRWVGLGLLANDPQRAVTILEQHLVWARQMGNRGLEARTLNMLASARARLGELQRSRELLRQALDLFIELGDAPWQFKVRSNLALRDQLDGDFASAQATLEDQIRQAPPGSYHHWFLHSELLYSALHQGHFAQALRYADSALESTSEDRKAFKILTVKCERAQVHVFTGRLEEAQADVDSCLRFRQDAGDAAVDPIPILASHAWLWQATVHLLQGEDALSEAALTEARKEAEIVPRPSARTLALTELAWAAFLLGHEEDFRELLEDLTLPEERRFAARLYLVRAAYALRVDPDDARRLLRLAEDLVHESDWHTSALYDLVRAALGPSDDSIGGSDRPSIEQLLEAARGRGDAVIGAIAEDMLRQLDDDPRPGAVAIPRLPRISPGGN